MQKITSHSACYVCNNIARSFSLILISASHNIKRPLINLFPLSVVFNIAIERRSIVLNF